MKHTVATNPILVIKDLHVSYGKIDVLRGINLVLYPGDAVVIKGENASGKSTLLRTILGLVKPKSGQIMYQNRDITQLNTDARVRLGISVIPENKRLFGELTVSENLLLCKWSFNNQLKIEECVNKIYTDFPLLWRQRNTIAANLSGGQQQLLSIARALLIPSHLLLADELSAGLDKKNQSQLFTKYIRKKEDCAYLIVEQFDKIFQDFKIKSMVIDKGKLRRE